MHRSPDELPYPITGAEEKKRRSTALVAVTLLSQPPSVESVDPSPASSYHQVVAVRPSCRRKATKELTLELEIKITTLLSFWSSLAVPSWSIICLLAQRRRRKEKASRRPDRGPDPTVLVGVGCSRSLGVVPPPSFTKSPSDLDADHPRRSQAVRTCPKALQSTAFGQRRRSEEKKTSVILHVSRPTGDSSGRRSPSTGLPSSPL